MKKGLLYPIIIILLGILAYSNSLNGKFIWDDITLIRDNLYLRHWTGVARFFIKDTTEGGTDKLYPYRPLQMASYALEYSIWRLNVLGYHAVNMVLHILTALCVYWLLNILFKDYLVCFLTGAFFVLHPIHTEAVSYISGRADPLAALFLLLCIISYIKMTDSRNVYYMILTIVFYVLALLSRENSLILPFLLLIYHYVFGKKIKLKPFLAILIITLIYLVSRLSFLEPPVSPFAATTILQRIPGFFAAISQYLRLMAFPFDLHMEYGKILFRLTDPRVAAGMLLSLILTAGLIIYGKRNKLISFSILWFFTTLLPQSNLYPLNSYMAEHWLYLPSIGLFLLLAEGIGRVVSNNRFRLSAMLFTASLLIFYAYATIRQNNYWREPAQFYERTIKYVPESKSAYSNLAVIYNAAGKKKEALALYSKALAIDPDDPIACNNAAKLLGESGNVAEALVLFNRAIASNPKYAIAHNNLGNLYDMIGKREEAVKAYNKAIEIDPDMPLAYNNLANQYNTLGKKKEALSLYNKALALDPSFAAVYNNMAAVYYDLGERDKARGMLEKALSLDPTLNMARENLKKIKGSEVRRI